MLHRGYLNAPGPSVRWPKSRPSSRSSPGAGHGHPQHEHQPRKANMCSPSARWRDRTKPWAQQHPLKFDSIYFSPLSSPKLTPFCANQKEQFRAPGTTNPRAVTFQERKMKINPRELIQKAAGVLPCKLHAAPLHRTIPPSCSVTRWLQQNSGWFLGGKHREGFAFACRPSSCRP